MAEQIKESKELTLQSLDKAVRSAAAFRSRRRLQPAGGEGDKVFPTTVAGAAYAFVGHAHADGHLPTLGAFLLGDISLTIRRHVLRALGRVRELPTKGGQDRKWRERTRMATVGTRGVGQSEGD